MAEKQTTTIRVYEEDRKRISAYGLFGESFADVVSRILDEYEKMRESKKVNPPEATSAPSLA